MWEMHCICLCSSESSGRHISSDTWSKRVSASPRLQSVLTALYFHMKCTISVAHIQHHTTARVCECVYVCVCTCVCVLLWMCVCLTQYKFRDPLHLQFSVMIICKSDTLKTLITSPYFKLEYCWYLIFFCKLAALLLPVKFMRRHFVLFFSVWKAMIRWKVA